MWNFLQLALKNGVDALNSPAITAIVISQNETLPKVTKYSRRDEHKTQTSVNK